MFSASASVASAPVKETNLSATDFLSRVARFSRAHPFQLWRPLYHQEISDVPITEEQANHCRLTELSAARSTEALVDRTPVRQPEQLPDLDCTVLEMPHSSTTCLEIKRCWAE